GRLDRVVVPDPLDVHARGPDEPPDEEFPEELARRNRLTGEELAPVRAPAPDLRPERPLLQADGGPLEASEMRLLGRQVGPLALPRPERLQKAGEGIALGEEAGEAGTLAIELLHLPGQPGLRGFGGAPRRGVAVQGGRNRPFDALRR